MPKIYRAGFLNSCELIICVWDKGHKWNFISQKEMHNFMESPICMGEERVKNPLHPTQKPIKILKHFIRIASDQNDVVFDPFMGVGSSGVAALQMGRKFIGFEIDKKYFSAAEKRIKNVPEPLFDAKDMIAEKQCYIPKIKRPVLELQYTP
jgi:site-specific DNA-methyltransferase (adenine-specific)/modification methylase